MIRVCYYNDYPNEGAELVMAESVSHDRSGRRFLLRLPFDDNYVRIEINPDIESEVIATWFGKALESGYIDLRPLQNGYPTERREESDEPS